jgi:hypothetical protein
VDGVPLESYLEINLPTSGEICSIKETLAKHNINITLDAEEVTSMSLALGFFSYSPSGFELPYLL